MKPKVYGDSKHLDITVDDELRNMPLEQLKAERDALRAEIIAEYEAAKQLPDPDTVDADSLKMMKKLMNPKNRR